ncbi:borealin-like [Anopheles bellator]|uniref:borealin-like n=1 Tax=Anopheles bellator TaxID=139047 RepID=UPI002648D529|nr:borealin-like [Anopheles bellator]
MVRTKISRKTASKRNRSSQQEERFANAMRELDIMYESFMISIEAKEAADLEKLNCNVGMIRSRIPKEVLQMTMGELRRSGCNQFVDVLKMGQAEMDELVQNHTAISNESIDDDQLQVPVLRQSSKSDDGYQTEDNGQRGSADLLASAKASQSRPMGPLSSAMKATNARRRSNSVSGHTIRTPFKGQSHVQSALLFGTKSKHHYATTPAATSRGFMFEPSERCSRPKMRTPMPEPSRKRPQTVSTDRGISQITLKVDPNTPLTFMRHPRAGESVFSLTGSPVVSAATFRNTKHFNIPVPNGMLSLQPGELLDDVDPEVLPRFDSDTLDYLKGLQMSLNKIMRYAEDCNFHMK